MPEDGHMASTKKSSLQGLAPLPLEAWRAGRWPGSQRTTPRTRSAHTQAQPPAAGGHPLPLFEQHHAFLSTDHPAIQFANPASQSYGSDDVAHPPPASGQPLPWLEQHHSFFGMLHPACQFAKPSAQLNGSAGGGGAVGAIGAGGAVGTTITGGAVGAAVGGAAVGGQPRWWILQHHAFLPSSHWSSGSTAQLYGSPDGPGVVALVDCVGGGVGGGVGGIVGGDVGKGVGGTVGVVSGKAVEGRVVTQPVPSVKQQ